MSQAAINQESVNQVPAGTAQISDSWRDPWSLPLESLDPARAILFKENVHEEYFRRLRKEDPVHYTADSEFGAYWSITKYNDIVAIDSNHKVFSSYRNIVVGDGPDEFYSPMFIAQDPPIHDVQRRAAQPAVAPTQLADLEGLIRQRVCTILDELPVGEEFNWVDRVSIELTTQMLATLFDFPFDDRHLLPYWSDVATASPSTGRNDVTFEERNKVLQECLNYFGQLWNLRKNEPRKFDFISLLAHDPETKDMLDNPMEFLGNLILLIVGGNDTTRNSMSAGVIALNQNPTEYDKLRADHSLITNMVPEIIRWQTPLPYMRRTANEDIVIRDKQIKKGDQVLMWYVSGNRDEDVIDRPNDFIIDRQKARHHLSFGFGIHRCMGNRLAEMQLRIVWEEILKRFQTVEVVGEPERLLSSFVRGITNLPVRVHRL